MNLFHLNSRTLIELPHMNTLNGFDCDNERGYCEYYVQKAVLSSDPHTTNDYILMINQGNVVILNFRGLEPTIGRIVEGVPSEFICGMQLYIVHSRGELFVITRDGICNHPETKTYGVDEFVASKVDVDNENDEEVVDDLENRSLFLGFSASLAVEQYRCKANHIYFTDDCSTADHFSEKGGGKDMDIYNLLDDTIEPHYTGESYHRFSPPIWIFNTPFSV
ncbi:hypothetical protein MTR67_021705 [Solanum verrucosum]|uniref:KIB1-4 beta-propeller domain-containing protein n=1 Tax=Solanum verrucosum TaxID=315347 RepID=A0AAF0QWD6_SOLVR|nr:hypothetical protein MTR67_021705 [Solanum verrucosum]